MAKYVIICFLLINSAIAFGQYAEFDFLKRVHKFDPAEEGVVLEHDYAFTNSGDEPLIISEYKVACTCTKVEYPKKPILPGESGIIKLTFDTEGKIGWQYRLIELHANVKKSPYKLEFRVKVLNE